jgi:hypothetical protein
MKVNLASWQNVRRLLPPNIERRLPQLHLALTALLALGLVSFLALAALGRLHVGSATPPVKQAGTETASEEKLGRYRIESMPDAGVPFSAASRRGFLGIPYRDMLVFKYQGGFLECHLQIGRDEHKADIQTVPAQWPPLLKATEPPGEDTTFKEGYLIVAVLDHATTPEQALQPYLPHFFGLLATGPGGAPSLLPWPLVTCNHLRELRLFMVAKPPEGKEGANFTVSAPGRPIVFRTMFGPTPGDLTIRKLGGGKDLTPDKTMPLVEWEWDNTDLTVAARFLTQEEVERYRNQKVESGDPKSDSADPR